MKWLPVVFFCLVGIGCRQSSLLETQRIEIVLPGDWTVQTSTGYVRSDWWREIQSEGLHQWVGQVLEQNHDLRIAALRVKRSRIEARLAEYVNRPQVDVSLSGNNRQNNYIGLPFGGSGGSRSRFESYGASAGIRWEMDFWGLLRTGEAIAVAEANTVVADQQAAQLSLAAQAVRLWVQHTESLAQERLASESIRLLSQALRQLEIRLSAGRAQAVDVRQAMLELAEARSNRLHWSNRTAQLARSMNILSGEYPANQLSDSLAASSMPPMPADVPAGVPAELLGRRPDLIAALARVHVANLRIAEADASLLPRVALTASGGTSSDALKGLVKGDSLIWSIGSSISQTILFPDEQQAQLGSRTALAEEAVLVYRQRLMQALREVESALNSGVYLAKQRSQLLAAVDHAHHVRVLTSKRYEAGLASATMLLAAERRLLTAQSALASMRLAEWENRINLHLAIGGDLSKEMP